MIENVRFVAGDSEWRGEEGSLALSGEVEVDDSLALETQLPLAIPSSIHHPNSIGEFCFYKSP
jgi:hypothetical protein